jgi:CheY-like chemotaxis protein
MDAHQKILLLDDDPDLLDMYREVLAQLPSHPEIQTTTTGPRAMALLESEPFSLFICDLRMPKMDGLQVLSIVRRKHPQLRTVVLTSVMDEQFRSRVYALGVDLFWQKPGTDAEIKMFLECLESLLGREEVGGFRGVQSKSLVDIIQLECLSQSSAILRISNGALNGRIWIQDGEVIDAEADDLRGEEAFSRILSWKAGNFESLAPDASRPRTIFKSYNGLLLESAQAMDEMQGRAAAGETQPGAKGPLALVSQVEGVEFVLVTQPGPDGTSEARGLEDRERMSKWSRLSLDRFRALGDRLQVGALEQIEALGPQRHVVLTQQRELEFCVGWKHSLTLEQVREAMKRILVLWAS